MRSSIVKVVVSCCAIVCGARPATAATGVQVETSLTKAKAWLYEQREGATWEKSPARDKSNEGQDVTGGQWGGQTALAVYALLAAGESAQDDRIKPAIDFLKKADMIGVYALGMRAQVWLRMPATPENRALLKKDADFLIKSMKVDEKSRGLYAYTPAAKPVSMSRTQYGVLGVWAAELGGVEVQQAYWKTVEEGWLRRQQPDGGWRYQEGDGRSGEPFPITAHMTAAGVASLYITQDYTLGLKAAGCTGNLSSAPIDRGMKWLVEHFDAVATDDRSPRSYPYSTLYAIERVGVASGAKYFGTVDWFAKGASFLVKEQKPDGSWAAGQFPGRFADTCNSMLFLARGRAPLVMNKLNYATPEAPDAAWNQRPRDVANFTRWLSDNVERDLAWQTVTIDAPAKDLAEAPVLYISGKDALTFTDAQRQKLKEVVEAGGLILGHADCGKPAFAMSFRKLASELYPQYEFRELPATSPVYSVFARTKWKTKPSVLSMSNGVREIVMLIPTADPAKAWQTRQSVGREELYQLAADVFLYATNKEKLQYRGESYFVTPNPEMKATRTIDVARVQYDGNWDPEPGAWRRLATLFHNDRKIDLNVTTVQAGADLGKAAFAHLTGTGKFALKPDGIAALKKFVDGGGTLLIDAAGGDGAFATAAEALAMQVADGKLVTLPPDAPLFAAGKVTAVDYRAFAKMNGAGATDAPRLQGIEKGGRVAVIVSRDDLTTGLLGPEMDGVIGYAPKSAVDLMSAALLYAAGK